MKSIQHNWSGLLLSQLVFVGIGYVSGSCSIQLKNLTEKPPIFLHAGGPLNVSGFMAPSNDHVIHLEFNDTMLLACPGPGNQLLYMNKTTNYRQVNASCASGSTVRVRSQPMSVYGLSCAKHAARTAEGDAHARCGAHAQGMRVRTGFRLLQGFLEVVTVCFDPQLLTPVYSNYTLVQSIAGKRAGGERAEFRAAGLFGAVSPRSAYERQNATLSALLGEQTWARVVAANASLTRGHLAARGGFVFWTQKRATFFYVNAAPQWLSINAGAWAHVEASARNLAALRGDLLVITGVHGVATLPDAQKRPTQLFLYVDGEQRKIPVPALYWKVVYDAHTREGAAVVASNNPFEDLSSRPDLQLCDDVCKRLRWLQLSADDFRLIYCCEVDNLRKHIIDLPQLDVTGLLEGPSFSKRARSRTWPKGRARSMSKSRARALAWARARRARTKSETQQGNVQKAEPAEV